PHPLASPAAAVDPGALAEESPETDDEAEPSTWGVDERGSLIGPGSDELLAELAEEPAPPEPWVDDAIDGLKRVLTMKLPPRLASVGRETWIRAEPTRKSRRIGYLRAGAIVKRAEKPAGFAGCKAGWYGIEPEG